MEAQSYTPTLTANYNLTQRSEDIKKRLTNIQRGVSPTLSTTKVISSTPKVQPEQKTVEAQSLNTTTTTENEAQTNRLENRMNFVAESGNGTTTENKSVWDRLHEDRDEVTTKLTATPTDGKTDAEKAWTNFARAVRNAESEEELLVTQGQSLSEFKQKSSQLADTLWNMYGSAGSTASVDALYGYILDSALASLFQKDTDDITRNREMYKTLVMGRNVDNVTTLEAMGRAWQSDNTQSKLGLYSLLYHISGQSEYWQDKIDEMQEKLLKENTDYAERSKPAEWLINSMPVLRQGLKTFATTALFGALGSVMGSISSGTSISLKTAFQMAVQNTSLKELSKTLGKNIGVQVGYGVSALGTFTRESGSLMLDLSELRDANGEGLSEEDIIKYGLIGGILNTIAEYGTPDPFSSRIKGFDFASIMGRSIKTAVLNTVTNSLASGISESTEEFVQSLVGDIVTYIAKKSANATGMSFDMSEDTADNFLKNATQAFAEAFMPSVIVGFAGTGRQYLTTFLTKAVTDEDFRKNLKTNALRTLDSVTTAPESTFTAKKEALKNQQATNRNKVVDITKIDIDSTKLSKEEKAEIKEKHADENGKMPVIEVTWDSKDKIYKPATEKDAQVAKYLYQVNRAKGFAVKVKDSEKARYSTKTVSVLSDMYSGDYDSDTKTITFANADDRENFLSDTFSANEVTDIDENTTTLKIYDENGNEETLTIKLGDVEQARNERLSKLETNTVTDKDGNDYEVFTDKSISRMLKSALPSMSTDEVKTLSSLIRALPANVQNDIIQKLKNGNGDIRDFIISEDMAKDEYKNNPAVLDALSKGRALSIVNDARLVLKDGKTKGKDVVHEVFHVLWNLYPEYRKNLVSALKQTLADSGQLSQLKEFYEENKADLDTLGNTASDGSVVGKVDSWESFLDLATKASEETTVESEQGKNTSYEELFARISTVILQDPSDTALDTLPAKLKKTFEAIVNKLKEIYTGLVGKSKHAPQTLEEAVLSVFNSNLDIDENGSGTRYAEEIAQEEEVRQKYFGTDQWLKAPNGKPTNLTERQWLQVRTPNFIKWFGDWINAPDNASVVRDENGEPKPVKHGTPNKDFYSFDSSKSGTTTDAGWLGQGFYFYGNNSTYAEQYAGADGRVLETFLNVRNPYFITDSETENLAEEDSPEASAEFTKDVKEDGYDGVFYNGDLNEEWCVFDPNQIKSATDNNGDFSTSDDDIRFSEEFDKYAEQRIEYDGRSGYDTEDNSDRTDDTRGLQADSEGSEGISERYQYERSVSATGLQGTARRFEGNELQQGAGNYVGRPSVNSGLTNLIAKHFEKSRIDSVQFVKLDKTVTNLEYFSQQLEKGRKGPFGYMVDGKSVSDLMNPDTEVYLSENGNTGFAIERNYHGHEGVNNISAVFNYAEKGVKPKNGVISILVNAVEQGGNVLDCFADGLQNMYAQVGFVPYAKNPFAVEYAIGDENWERDYLTKNKNLPPVMAMYFAYKDINDFARNVNNINLDTVFEDVPLADDYDTMLEERDRVVQDKKGIRYSEELDKNASTTNTGKVQNTNVKRKGNGDIFNPDNPYSILNRNLKNWESLEDGDVEQLIDANVYVPEKILEKYSNLAKVTEERAERTAIDRMLEVYPQLREMAQNAKSVNNFLVQAKKVFGATIEDSVAKRLTKYYNYSQTLSPTEFSQYFVEMYGSTSTTIADLLALKKLMSTRKVAKVTEDGKKITTVIANDTELAKLLVKVNRKMADEDARKIAKQIRRRQGRYVMDLARTLVKMGAETAQMENVDFDPNMTSWLAIALGTEQEDLWQTELKGGTVNSEMNENNSDKEKTDENNKIFKKAIDSNEESFRNLESKLEGKEIKRPTVSSLMRTINRLENQIEAQEMNHNSWKNAYYSAIDQIRLLSNERKAVFKKLSKLVKLNKNISSNYEAKAKRLQTLLMYTEHVGIMSDLVGASLDVQKAFYTEIVQRNKARNQLRRMMKYDTKNYDSYYIDSTMKYLYRFVHGVDKIAVVNDMSDNEYNNRATKQGARTEADTVNLVTYDFVAPDTDDMEQVDVEYNPNYPRIDLSNMPKELENVLWKDLSDGIKDGSIQFRYMTSEDLNELRNALALVKHLSKMSKNAKDEAKKSRRRTRVMAIFSAQYGFKASNLTTDEKNAILEKMSSDPNFGPNVLSYSDEDIEDYVRRHPEVLFAGNADDNKTKFDEVKDIIEVQYLKMQRVAETMDGKENGPLYENFFRPLFESYEQKKRWINKRQETFGYDLRTILGEGNPDDKKTIRRNKKLLNEEKLFRNHTLFDGTATIKLTGWEQIGAYIYSKNIFGFTKLIANDGNNLSLEEIARINPTDTLKFIDLALAQRAQNADVAQGQTNRWYWSQTAKKDGTSYYARDILNHVTEDELNEVRQKIVSGEIDPKGSLSQMMMDIGDTMIKHVSERENEIVRAGYDDYNLLTVLQENYFPLRALDDNLLLQKIENEKGNANVSKGMLMNRQLTITYRLNLNPLVTMYSAIQQQEALINMSQSINDANWLMSAKGGNLKGLLTQKFGSRWGNYFEDYLAVMAGAGDMDLEDMDKLLNKFIGNIAVSRIGANIMVSAKQLVSLIPAMTKGEITPFETLKAFQKLTGNKKDAWKAFIEQQSPSTFYSAYNVEAEKSQRFDETMGGDNILSDMRETTMWLTEKLDGLTKGAIWIAKYEKEIQKGASVQDASFRATQLVQTTQSITDDPSLSKLQRNKNPLVKIAFMFTNDAFQTWNMITSDIPNAWKQGNRRKAIVEASGILFANAVLAFLAGGWLPDDDDDEEDDGFQWGDFLADWGLEALGNVPVGGSFLTEAFQGFSSPFYQGPTQLANLTGMIKKQVQYWTTDGKEGQDYEAGDYIDRLFKLVMEGGVSLTGGPVITGERAYKALFPDGASDGITKNANSLWYMLGSKYGKALYSGD